MGGADRLDGAYRSRRGWVASVLCVDACYELLQPSRGFGRAELLSAPIPEAGLCGIRSKSLHAELVDQVRIKRAAKLQRGLCSARFCCSPQQQAR